jgi:hypothetical protein
VGTFDRCDSVVQSIRLEDALSSCQGEFDSLSDWCGGEERDFVILPQYLPQWPPTLGDIQRHQTAQRVGQSGLWRWRATPPDTPEWVSNTAALTPIATPLPAIDC